MKNLKGLVAALTLTTAAGISHAAAPSALDSRDTKTLREAAQVLEALTAAPDNGIPNELLGRASCIAVFPSVAKGAFIVGGKFGRGVVTCRQADGRMGAPAFFTIGGASVGFQIGGQTADFVLLVMNEDGMHHLLQDKFSLGGEATATAGPVGRTAHAATDLQLQAQILSWSRSRGLFAGLALDGAVIKPNTEANERLYGHPVTARDILLDSKQGVPAPASKFVDTVRRLSLAEGVKEARERYAGEDEGDDDDE